LIGYRSEVKFAAGIRALAMARGHLSARLVRKLRSRD